MKKTIILAFSLALVSFLNCSNSSNTTENKKVVQSEDTQGTYTIDGKTYTGKVSTQEFVNKNFSVLCEYSDESSSDYKKWKYDLLQITFHNEAEALKGGTFKVSSTSAINQETGYVSLGGHEGFGNLFGDGKGTITVSNKTIKILNIKAFQYPITHQGENKSCIINNASITFQ